MFPLKSSYLSTAERFSGMPASIVRPRKNRTLKQSMLWPSCGVIDYSYTIIVKYDNCAFEWYIVEIPPVMHHWAALFWKFKVKIHLCHFKVGRSLVTIASNVAQGRLNRSELSSDDEWGDSFKLMVDYEDDYLKKTYLNKTMLFLISERFSLS